MLLQRGTFLSPPRSNTIRGTVFTISSTTFTMLYSRFLLTFLMLIFFILSALAAPIGRESPAVMVDSATNQLPSVSADAVIQEETHVFDWAAQGSNPA